MQPASMPRAGGDGGIPTRSGRCTRSVSTTDRPISAGTTSRQVECAGRVSLRSTPRQASRPLGRHVDNVVWLLVDRDRLRQRQFDFANGQRRHSLAAFDAATGKLLLSPDVRNSTAVPPSTPWRDSDRRSSLGVSRWSNPTRVRICCLRPGLRRPEDVELDADSDVTCLLESDGSVLAGGGFFINSQYRRTVRTRPRNGAIIVLPELGFTRVCDIAGRHYLQVPGTISTTPRTNIASFDARRRDHAVECRRECGRVRPRHDDGGLCRRLLRRSTAALIASRTQSLGCLSAPTNPGRQ